MSIDEQHLSAALAHFIDATEGVDLLPDETITAVTDRLEVLRRAGRSTVLIRAGGELLTTWEVAEALVEACNGDPTEVLRVVGYAFTKRRPRVGDAF